MKDLSLFFLIAFVTIPVKSDDPLCAGLPHDEEVVFASPLDCTQYYRCFNGVFSIEKCSEGLFFSEYNKACVSAEYAECQGGSGSPIESTSPVPSTSTPEPTTPEPTTPEPTTPEPTTPEPTTPEPTTPEPTTPEPTTPEPTTTESTTPETTTESTTPFPTTTTEPTTGTTPDDVDPRCIDGNTSYWPHPRDCSKYIECFEGDSYEMACPANTYFSDEHKKCTGAAESECCRNNSSQCK